MFKVLITSLVFLTAVFPAFAKATNIAELNPIQSLKITSKYFNEAIEYNVTLPKSYNEAKGKDKKYFVIFDLHPRSQPYISGLHDWMSHNSEWPWLESIVVTPANYNPEFVKLFRQIESEPTNHTVLDFFEFDLFNAIDQKYRTNGFRIYSGFMGNGALGLFSLINRPALFNAYIISSPSLANDYGLITSEASKKLAKLDDQIRFLYLSTGDHQYEQGNLSSFDLFEEALTASSPKSLDWQVHHNTQNNYMSRPIVSLVNGIEALFDDIHTDLKADSEISKNGIQAIIEHYEKISNNKYGFDISAEGSLKALAKSLIKTDPQKALFTYQKTVELYPESAYALSSLAKAHDLLGDINRAIEYQSQAVEKSKSMITWHQNKHKQYLDEYKTKLNKGAE